MGQIKEVVLPDIGDFDEVDVVEILVAAGESVAVDDALISLESDKATMDVPAPIAGIVKEIKVVAGNPVAKGAVILTLEVPDGDMGDFGDKAADPPAPAAADKAAPKKEEKEAAESVRATPPPPSVIDEEAFRRAYASPAVRRLAREKRVDLGRVRGTGRKDRLTREDVLAFAAGAPGSAGAKAPAAGSAQGGGVAALPPMPVIDFSRFGEIRIEPLSRIRKISAASLHRSWLHVPHVTQFEEADVTQLEAFRKGRGAAAAQEKEVKLTVLAFLMKASVAALREFPAFNSSLTPDGEGLILKRYYHLGIAVDTQDGLVVPVIRDVDKKGLLELAGELAEVSGRAREKKLRPDDIQGASFTISSLGGIGGTAFTPIVNAPEVAILGVSRSRMKPVWRDGEFVPRLMLPLSLSYDHRVIDGASAARFTTYLAQVLSDLRIMLL